MDKFVKDQLEACGCGDYVDIFRENEVDEEAFRELKFEDIRAMVPGKIGPQRKIMSCIESLELMETKTEDAVVFKEKVETGARPASRDDETNHVGSVESPSSRSNGTSALSSLFEKFGLELPPSSPVASRVAVPESRPFIGFNLNSNITINGDASAGLINSNTSNSGSRSRQKKGKKVSARLQQHQKKLPVYIQKDEFVKMVHKHQILIVEGETGSGKSTQLTQYLQAAGCGVTGKIGCTQPRRIAAKALARRVAEETGSTLGEEVGYRVRFENCTQPTTEITYMTDGILLQELASQPNVYNYSAIMLDEAHERSLNTDILLGLLKSATRTRKDLKIIVASATLDTEKFSNYFFGAPIIKIKGRDFPVDVRYEAFPVPDYVNTCIRKVLEINNHEPEGDILVFLCGQDKIELCVDKLEEKDELRELWIVPCYAALGPEDQAKVFAPAPEGYKRKVIIATNIAETSLTIDGIVYVVDSGVTKVSHYDPKTGLKTLAVEMITKAQAKQRAGRAGRTRPGVAYRLYTEEYFNKMKDNPVPEIQRSNLEHGLLLLASHGIEDVENFDFIDPPLPEQVEDSLQELRYLGALDRNNRLTKLGRQIANFPLDPRLSKVLLTSVQLNCVKEMLTVVAMLSVQSSGKIYYRPKKRQYQADKCKAEFNQPEGDFHTFLKVWENWMSVGYSEKFCKDNFLNYKALNEVYEIRQQLVAIMESNKFKVSRQLNLLPDPDALQKALVSGYYSRIACREHGRGRGFGYRRAFGARDLLYIHGSSSLMKNNPDWILFEELLNTGEKAFMLTAAAIKPRWINEYAPDYMEEFICRFPYAL